MNFFKTLNQFLAITLCLSLFSATNVFSAGSRDNIPGGNVPGGGDTPPPGGNGGGGNNPPPQQASTAPSPSSTGCEYAQNFPCPQLNTPNNPDSAGHAAPYCNQMKHNDRACNLQFQLAIAYSAAAVVCATACYGSIWSFGTAGPWLEAMCYAGTSGVMLMDMMKGNSIVEDAKKDASRVNGELARSWGIDAKLITAVAGVPAAALATIAGGAHGAGAKIGACVSTGLNTVMAIYKKVDQGQIKDNSREQFDKMCEVASCTPRIDPLNPNGDGGLASFTGTGNPNSVRDGRSPITLTGDIDKIKSALKSGKLAQSLVTAGNGFGSKSPEDFQNAFDNFEKGTGINLADAINDASQNGLASTLGKLAEGNSNQKGIEDALQKLEDDTLKFYTGSEAQFASTGAGGVQKKAAGNPFSALLGGRTPSATGSGSAENISFGGFQGDIWHAGTTKSIFEIVSDKTQAVADRVGH